jgi:hypothetical protein
MAMLLTMVASIYLFSFKPTLQVCIWFILDRIFFPVFVSFVFFTWNNPAAFLGYCHMHHVTPYVLCSSTHARGLARDKRSTCQDLKASCRRRKDRFLN